MTNYDSKIGVGHPSHTEAIRKGLADELTPGPFSIWLMAALCVVLLIARLGEFDPSDSNG